MSYSLNNYSDGLRLCLSVASHCAVKGLISSVATITIFEKRGIGAMEYFKVKSVKRFLDVGRKLLSAGIAQW